MTPTEKLLSRLPKKYHHMVKKLEQDYGLVDDCKYMLYFAFDVVLFGYDRVWAYPVRNITEAIDIITHDVEYVSKEDHMDTLLRESEKWLLDHMESEVTV